jgi:hypothetical protein
MTRGKLNTVAMFWEQVEKSDDHWHWRGTTTSDGYGVFSLRVTGFTDSLAHRIAYQLERGQIPVGLHIDHLCRVRHCVNPDHMELVTRGENVRRGNNHNRDKTHCPQGHEYTEENTYRRPGDPTQRYCRSCMAVRSKDGHTQRWRKRKAMSA